MRWLVALGIIEVAGLVAGCGSRNSPAPIIQITSTPKTTSSSWHPKLTTEQTKPRLPVTASKAEDQINSGIILNKLPVEPTAHYKRDKSAVAYHPPKLLNATMINGIAWALPTSGIILHPYSPLRKGIDIGGQEGQSIVAAAAGTVAYSGHGLSGYGNLIILKHDNHYLTAYAHNQVNLVQEGDTVQVKQIIAKLGKTDSDRPLLHFELRKEGKPIDPTPIFSVN